VIAKYLTPPKGIEESDSLKGDDDVKVWLDRLSTIEEDVMLVGHMYFLNDFAYCLITNTATPPPPMKKGDEYAKKIDFEKSSMVCLEKREKGWSLKWMVTPDMIRTKIE
jgi:phosphohistidine phosphatase SixA